MSGSYFPTGAAFDTGDCGRPAPAPDVGRASVATEQAPAPVRPAVVGPVRCGFANCSYLLVAACDGNRGPLYKHQRNAHAEQGVHWLAHVQRLPGCPRNLLEPAASSSGFEACSACHNLVAKNGCADCKKLGTCSKVLITQSMLDAAAAPRVASVPRVPPPQPRERGAVQDPLPQPERGAALDTLPPPETPDDDSNSQVSASSSDVRADSLLYDQFLIAPCAVCTLVRSSGSAAMLKCGCPADGRTLVHGDCLESAVLKLVAEGEPGVLFSADELHITCHRCKVQVPVSRLYSTGCHTPYQFPDALRPYFVADSDQQSGHDPPGDGSDSGSEQGEQQPQHDLPDDDGDAGSDTGGQRPQHDPDEDDHSSHSAHGDDPPQDPADADAVFGHWTPSTDSIRHLLRRKNRVFLCIFDTVLCMSRTHADIMAQMTIRLFSLQEHCVASGDQEGLDAVTMLQYLLPGLLLSPDVSVPRNERFARVQELDLADLVERLLTYTEHAPCPALTARTEEQIRRQATRTAKCPNGMSRAAELLSGTEQQSPRSQETVDKLAAKYPKQQFTNAAMHQAARAGVATAAAAMSSADPDEHMQYEADQWESAIKAGVMGKLLTSAPGPDGLRYSHVQLMLATGHGGELLRRMAYWPALFFSPQCPGMTPFYWQSHTQSILSALGEKCRPVSCGNVFRRAICAAMARLSKAVFARKFKERGQLAWESAGTEQHAFKAQSHHDAERWVLATDVSNAYNSMNTLAILAPTGLPSIAAPVVQYMVHTHCNNVPCSLFRGEGGVVEYLTETGSQQGCAFGSLYFAAGLSTLSTATEGSALGDAIESAHLADDSDGAYYYATRPTHDNITLVEKRYASLGCMLNRAKTLLLPPANFEMTDAVRADIADQGITLAERGMRVTGVPVGSDEFIQDYLDAHVDAATDPNKLHKLAEQLSLLPDKQVSLLLLRHCFAPRVVHLARTVKPDLFVPAIGAKIDSLTMHVLQRILGISSSQTQQQHFESCTSVFAAHQQQQAYLSTKHGGLGLMCLSYAAAPAYVASVYSSCAGTLSAEALPAGDHRDALLQGVTTAAQWPSAVTHAISDLLDQGVSAQKLQEMLPTQWVQAASSAVQARQQDPALAHAAAEQHVAAVVDFTAAPSSSKVQSKLAAALKPARLQQYKASLQQLPSDAAAALRGVESCNQAAARSLSQAAPEANLYLSGIPSGPTAIPGPLMTLALRRQLGVRTTFSSEHCPQHGNNTSFKADSQHADSCMQSGVRTTVHSIVCKGVGAVLTEAGVTGTRYEVSSCLRGPKAVAKMRGRARKSQPPYRMDILLQAGSLSGATDPEYRDKEMLIDVSTRHNTSTSNIQLLKTHLVAGAAAAKGVTDKLIHYDGTYTPSVQKLVSAVVETHGRMAPPLKEFLEQVAVHAASRVPCATDAQRKTVAARKLWRYQVVLSATLQRAMSIAELRYVAKLRLSEICSARMCQCLRLYGICMKRPQ